MNIYFGPDNSQGENKPSRKKYSSGEISLESMNGEEYVVLSYYLNAFIPAMGNSETDTSNTPGTTKVPEAFKKSFDE